MMNALAKLRYIKHYGFQRLYFWQCEIYLRDILYGNVLIGYVLVGLLERILTWLTPQGVPSSGAARFERHTLGWARCAHQRRVHPARTFTDLHTENLEIEHFFHIGLYASLFYTEQTRN